MHSVRTATVVAFIFITISIKASEGCFYKPCDHGYLRSDTSGTCLKLYQYKRTWQKARDTCKKESADLLKIMDEDMNKFITELLFTDSGTLYWIGLNDNKAEGTFRWLDEEEEVNHTAWDDFHFLIHNVLGDSFDCVAILSFKDNNTDEWIAHTCDSNVQFICEKNTDCYPGYYGKTCTEKCSKNCGKQNNACQRLNGTCDYGCDPGYLGASCRRGCARGYYGEGCAKKCHEKCSSCDKVNGKCLRCNYGYNNSGGNCTSNLQYQELTKEAALVSVLLVVGVISVSAAFAIGSLLYRARMSA